VCLCVCVLAQTLVTAFCPNLQECSMLRTELGLGNASAHDAGR